MSEGENMHAVNILKSEYQNQGERLAVGCLGILEGLVSTRKACKTSCVMGGS